MSLSHEGCFSRPKGLSQPHCSNRAQFRFLIGSAPRNGVGANFMRTIIAICVLLFASPAFALLEETVNIALGKVPYYARGVFPARFFGGREPGHTAPAD